MQKYHYYGNESPVAELRETSDFRGYRAFKQALYCFQVFNGLNATGRLDNATKQLMERPRCGVPDITSFEDLQQLAGCIRGSQSRRKRYVVSGTTLRSR